MDKFVFAALLVVCCLFIVPPSSAECCRTSHGQCADGTNGTPCCGVGGCNIFCCHCNGGCRQDQSYGPNYGWGPGGARK